MDVAAEVHPDPGGGKGGCDMRCGAAAQGFGFSEQGAFEIVAILERVERGVVRQGQQAFALCPGAGCDAGDPGQEEGFHAQQGRPARGGRVDEGALLPFAPVAVARLEDVGVDQEEPKTAFRLHEVGGVHQAAGGVAIRRAGVEHAVGGGIGRTEGAFPSAGSAAGGRARRRPSGKSPSGWPRQRSFGVRVGAWRSSAASAGSEVASPVPVGGPEAGGGVLAERAEHVMIAGDRVEAEIGRGVEAGGEAGGRLGLPVIGIVAQKHDMADAAGADFRKGGVEGHAAFVEHAGGAGGVVPASDRQARPFATMPGMS